MRVARSVTDSTGGRVGHNEGAAMTRLVTEEKQARQGGEDQEGKRAKGKGKKKQSVLFPYRTVRCVLCTLPLITLYSCSFPTAATLVLNTRHDLSNCKARSSCGSLPSSPSLICES